MKDMYNAGVIVLSFGVAFLGSYISITACEQFRLCSIGIIYSRYVPPFAYLVMMSICLGGVGIWCMHFIGMSAVSLSDQQGGTVEIRYNIAITLISLVLVILSTLAGFYISSQDKIFMKTKREIVDMFVEDAAKMSMKEVRKMKSFQMVSIIGTRAPQHLLLGGLVTGSGVVLMHYLGMAAMRFEGHIVWNIGVIVGSVIIAFVASVAAFWIQFRLLSIYPDKENLRVASAFTMAIAVCGMHYTGMSAADFVFDASVTVDISSTISSEEAFVSGIVAAAVVALIAGMIALADLRQAVQRMSTELYRADTVLKALPNNGSNCSSVQKYFQKRKLNRFSLGVLNNTVTLQDLDGEHEDNASTASVEEAPSWLTLALYRCCGGAAPTYRSYGGASVTSEASVHAQPESSYHSHHGPHHHHHHHQYHQNNNLQYQRHIGGEQSPPMRSVPKPQPTIASPPTGHYTSENTSIAGTSVDSNKVIVTDVEMGFSLPVLQHSGDQ